MDSTTIRPPTFLYFKASDIVSAFLEAVDEHPCEAFLQMTISLEDKVGREVTPDVLRTMIYRFRRKIRRISALPDGLNRLSAMMGIDAEDLRRFEQLKGITSRRGLRQRARQLVESGIHDNQIIIARLKTWAFENMIDQPTPGSLEVIASATRREYGLVNKLEQTIERKELNAKIILMRHACIGPKEIGIRLHVRLGVVRSVLALAARKGARFPSLKRLRIGSRISINMAA